MYISKINLPFLSKSFVDTGTVVEASLVGIGTPQKSHRFIARRIPKKINFFWFLFFDQNVLTFFMIFLPFLSFLIMILLPSDSFSFFDFFWPLFFTFIFGIFIKYLNYTN